MIRHIFAPLMAVLLISLTGCDTYKEEQSAKSEPEKPSVVKSEPEMPRAMQTEDAFIQTNLESSRMAMKTLAGSLQSELKAAMQAGGPIQALDVCHTKAPELTAFATKYQGDGTIVSRTSLKYRNPNNSPQEWQTAVLEEFETRKLAGEDPKSLEFHQIATTDGKKEFRYMKAIPTGEVCLKCHGVDIDPAVSEKLNTLYPQDKATGFNIGDIRGAFVVIKPL